jgi:hypothetical protein
MGVLGYPVARGICKGCKGRGLREGKLIEIY